MEKLYVSVVSVWTWLVLIGALVLWLPVLAVLRLVTGPLDPGRYYVGLFFRKVAVVTATLNPLWRFRRSGTPVADPRRPYVVVSNHESFADILLISHLPWEMKWMSKAELFRLPVLGWDMWLAGDIPVRRTSVRSGLEAMHRCRDVLRQRVSVIIFPEGTRSSTGEMLPFKNGAFRLAIEAGVPILPLAVVGTGTALPKHDWRLGRSEAEVRVLPPLETSGLTLKDVPALKARARAMIAEARAEMRRALSPRNDGPTFPVPPAG